MVTHTLAAVSEDPNILFEDAHLLIVNKPANMLSVPGKGPDKQDCAIARIQRRFPTALSVHRLDYATSGLLVVALHKNVHRALSKQFEQRKINKDYVACVDGLVEKEQGEINLPLICDWPNRPLQKVDFEDGKPALTHYQVIARDHLNHTSRVKLIPITGRSHQLRVHLQQLGHPILGDEFYANDTVKAKSTRLLLHAQRLAFEHPVTGKLITIDSQAEF